MSDIELYKRPKSSKFQCKFTINGEVIRKSTNETDREQALKKARALQDELVSKTKRRLSYEEAAEHFFAVAEAGALKETTIATYRSSMTNIHEHLGNFFLDELTTEKIDDFVHLRMQTPVANKKEPTRGPAVRRDLSFLSSLYTFARRLPLGPTHHPVRAYDKSYIPEAKARQNWCRKEIFDKVLSACDKDYQRLLIKLAAYTGMRRREITGLMRSEIDHDAQAIILDVGRTKTAKSRLIPLLPELYLALCQHINTTSKHSIYGDSIYVFPSRGKTGHIVEVKRFFKKACAMAGVPDMHFHDLRHTFTSWAHQAGMKEGVIQDILGHSTQTMTRRYRHLRKQDLVDEMKKLKFY